MKKHIVSKKFFLSDDTVVVAHSLIGKFLVSELGQEREAYMITEVEAYDGFHDRASHAYRGKTPRNSIMFGAAGYWYVYLVYGMHHMLNVVTGSVGYPGAVLIRGLAEMNGPARLTKKLSITRAMNGTRVGKSSGLWIEDRGIQIPNARIQALPRIGVAYAGALWAGKRYRFRLR